MIIFHLSLEDSAPTYHILVCLVETLVQAGIVVGPSFVSCSSCYDCQAEGICAV